MKVLFFTNFIPPYRGPVLKELKKLIPGLQIWLSTPMESDRAWKANWDGLDVRIQKTFSFAERRRHPHGFQDKVQIHIPWDTLPILFRERPETILTAEFGMRTLQCALYKLLHPRTQFIVWATLSEHTEKGRGVFRRLLRRFILKMTDKIIANGESGARYLAGFQFPDDRIFRVPQTTDLTPFLSIQRDPLPQCLRFLYSGRLIELKGLHLFLEGLIQAAKRNPLRQIEWWLLGDGPLTESLLTKPLPANLRLIHLPERSYEELPVIYSQCHVLAFPTLADEWGLVVIEAMAAGMPVLGSDFGQAVEELVEEGKTGWRFITTSKEKLNQALDRCLSTHSDDITLMGFQARERVRSLSPIEISTRIRDALVKR